MNYFFYSVMCQRFLKMLAEMRRNQIFILFKEVCIVSRIASDVAEEDKHSYANAMRVNKRSMSKCQLNVKQNESFKSLLCLYKS